MDHDPQRLEALADVGRRFGLMMAVPRSDRGKMAEAMADPLLQEKAAELRAQTGSLQAETEAIPRKLDIAEEQARAMGGWRQAEAEELRGRNPTKENVAAIAAGPRYAAVYAQLMRTQAEHELDPVRKQKLLAEANMAEQHARQFGALADLGGGLPKAVGAADENGRGGTIFMTPGQQANAARTGQFIMGKPTGAEANRLDIARTATTTHGQLQDMLSDPEVQQNLGPLMGRGFRIEQAVGQTTSPKTQEFLSEVNSFLSAQMALHQSRNFHVVEQLQHRFANEHMAPADFAAGLAGIAHWSENTLANAPRNPGIHAGGMPSIPGARSPVASPSTDGVDAEMNDVLNSLRQSRSPQ